MNNPNMNNPEQSKQRGRSGWADTKAKIKSKWNRLSDSQLDGLESDFDRLPEQIRKTYGYSQQQADREFSEFKMSLESGSGSQNSDMRQENRQKNQRDDNSNQTRFGAV